MEGVNAPKFDKSGVTVLEACEGCDFNDDTAGG